MTKPRTKPSLSNGTVPAAQHEGGAAATKLIAAAATLFTRTLVNKAIAGNMKALRLCIERLVPISRERALPVKIPAAQDALQITIALRAVFDGLGAGQLTAGEAQKLAGLLESQRKAIETYELEQRLQALESGSDELDQDELDQPDQPTPTEHAQ